MAKTHEGFEREFKEAGRALSGKVDPDYSTEDRQAPQAVFNARIKSYEPVVVVEFDFADEERREYVPKWEYDRDFGEAKERTVRAEAALFRVRATLMAFMQGESGSPFTEPYTAVRAALEEIDALEADR
jgi:hypothetical protein